jgi:hypothetical protein
MYGLLGVVETRRKALQEWVLEVDWPEWGSEEIKLSFKCPWWGEERNVNWGQLGRAICRCEWGIHDQLSVEKENWGERD